MKKQFLISLLMLVAVNAPAFGMFKAAKIYAANVAANAYLLIANASKVSVARMRENMQDIPATLRGSQAAFKGSFNPFLRAELRGEKRVWNTLDKKIKDLDYEVFSAKYDLKKADKLVVSESLKLKLINSAISFCCQESSLRQEQKNQNPAQEEAVKSVEKAEAKKVEVENRWKAAFENHKSMLSLRGDLLKIYANQKEEEKYAAATKSLCETVSDKFKGL